MDSQITEIAYGVKVLYEDNHLIVAIKPAGVLSQSDGSNAPDMLTILKAYIKDKYQKPGEVPESWFSRARAKQHQDFPSR